MPELSPGARRALPFWGAIEASAAGELSTADMWAAINAQAEGLPEGMPRPSASDVSQLRSYASTIQHTSDRLAAADPAERLDSRYVAEAPWSRSSAEQRALGVMQVRYQHTTIGPDGPQTQWRTSTFQGALPRTVAELHAALAEDAARLAEGYGMEHVNYFDVQALLV